MINHETILSTTQDKMTLLQWLKKVEAALSNASATAFNVTPVSAGVYKFVLTFADGTTLESDSVSLALDDFIVGGRLTEESHIVLVKNDGDEIDLGSIFAADKLYIKNKICDINGNFLFESGGAASQLVSGLTDYGTKYVVNGNELIVCFQFEIAAGTALERGTMFGGIEIPSWVFARIHPPVSVYTQVMEKFNYSVYETTLHAVVSKGANRFSFSNLEDIASVNHVTRYRIQFSLMLD